MKKLLAVAVMVLSSMAFAQDGGAQMKAAPAEGQGMGQWKPMEVTKKDTKGLDELFKGWMGAFMAKDMNKAAEYVDFPVTMVTDDGKGNAVTANWDKDTWVKNMTQSMSQMPEPKKGEKMPEPKHNYEFIANEIAACTSSMTMPMGKKKMTIKSFSLAVKKDGKWLVKTMAESGWGSMAQEGGQK